MPPLAPFAAPPAYLPHPLPGDTDEKVEELGMEDHVRVNLNEVSSHFFFESFHLSLSKHNLPVAILSRWSP